MARFEISDKLPIGVATTYNIGFESIVVMSLFNSKYSHLKGRKEEALAEKYLKKAGLKFVTRNFYSRYGEIDLIFKDKEQLVFVEVKARKIGAQVSALESITQAKLQKIRKTAQFYMIQFDEIPSCRFDVIAINTGNDKRDSHIEWIQNAF